MKASEFTTEAVRQRLDPKCWTGKHKEGTKIKGGVRVNNCVPNESKDIIRESRTYKLWESAGRKICEAQLTANQIQQLFQQVEQGATSAGGNRTIVGQGKDAATAVNQAWEQLKTKVQNSGPIKNVDAAYDQAAAKLKQATGGDAGVMQYVEKYRAFAKAHPIAQSLIYSALIAAAGISGAGLGGAAALGLLKMTDKLLQGEKFSSAAYSGAKTGALAYGASLLKDLMSGTQGVTTSVDDPEWEKLRFQGDQVSVNQVVTTTNGNDTLKEVIQSIVGPNSKGEYLVRIVNNDDLREFVTKTPPPSVATNESINRYIDRNLTVYVWALNESIGNPRGGVQLTNEGIGNMFKSAVSKAGQWAQTKGHNLTTRVTADKLQSAWQRAGSPTDSDAIAKILQSAGVQPEIIKQIYTSMKIPAPVQGQPTVTPAKPVTTPAPAKPVTTQPAQPTAPTVGAGLAEEFDLIESIIENLAKHNGVDSEVIWEDLESLDDDELYVFAATSQLNEDWQKVNKKDKTDGMSRKAVKAYRREHPGSKLKTAVTTKPSKLKKGSKASKRRKSYCSRSKGQMNMHNISCAKTPDKAICKARRRWNC